MSIVSQIKQPKKDLTMERAEVLAKAKELGLEHHKSIQTVKLVEMIESVTGESMGYVKPEPKANVDQNMTTTDLRRSESKFKIVDGEETIRCMIHSGDRDNDELEMVGSVNGEPFQCQIGIEMDLPVKFLPAFEGAVIDRHVHIFDEEGNPTKKKRIKKERKYIVERL